MAPNPIDFDKVWAEFGRLGETGNFVVLATVCSILGLYCVALVFARRADKRDEAKVGKSASTWIHKTIAYDYGFSLLVSSHFWCFFIPLNCI